MIRNVFLPLLGVTILLAACTAAPPPAVTPQGEARFLVDPRIGFEATPSADVQRRFDAAWRFFLAGDFTEARRRLIELRSRAPEYAPAALADAAIDITEGKLQPAQAVVSRIESRYPRYTAARIYDAEIAIAEHKTRNAFDIYRAVAQQASVPPTVGERIAQLEQTLFEELYAAASTAPDAEAVALLREALALNPGAIDARVLLTQKLASQRAYEEALRVVAPLVNTPNADRVEVQQALAEIDAGQGRYQDALTRYERLSRLDPRFRQRLDEIKELWNAQNMPPQYLRALEADSVTRADFAVLLYWKVTSVRFAQNLGTPPIATDIEAIPGRDEIVRALALGILDVDSITRRAYPLRPLTAAGVSRLTARVLAARRAGCAGGIALDRVLASCALADPVTTVGADTPMSGRAVAALLDQVERLLGR